MNYKKIIALFSIAIALFLSAGIPQASAQTTGCPVGFICSQVTGTISATLESKPKADVVRVLDRNGSTTEAYLTATFAVKLKALDSDLSFGNPAKAFPVSLFKNGLLVKGFYSPSTVVATSYAATVPAGVTNYVGGLNGSFTLQKGKEAVVFITYKVSTGAGSSLDLPHGNYEVEMPSVNYGKTPSTTGISAVIEKVKDLPKAAVTQSGLILTYNNLAQEVLLTSNFTISVQAPVGEGIFISRNNYHARWIDQKGIRHSSNSQKPLELTAQGNASTSVSAELGTLYYIPAGQIQTFTATASVPPKEMFAGTYYASVAELSYHTRTLKYQSITLPANQTTARTIVGEVSPYVSSVSNKNPSIGDTITINGVRLAGSSVYFDTLATAIPLSVSSSGTSATFKIPNLPLNSEKSIQIFQLQHPQTGKSNRIAIDVFPSSTPTGTHSVTPSSSVVNSDQAINLRFGVPSNAIAAKLYLSCPAGVTIAAKGSLLCNSWYTFPTVPKNSDGIAFSLNNTTASDKNVVPNFYLYYPENPNFARGVTSQITVKPKAVAAIKATITVLGPNGGELLEQNKTHTISWDYTGLDNNDIINIGLRASNENVCWIGKTIAFARSYNFVPNQVKCDGSTVSLSSGGQFKAQVVVDKYANSIGVSDTSNNFFTISSLNTSTNPTTPTTPAPTVKKVSTITLSPLTFTSIPTNNAIPLTWTTDMSGVQGIVILSLYKGGVLYKDVDSVESMGGNGSKSIFIPQTTPAGTYKVRATFINQATNSGPYAETSEFKITNSIQDASIWTAIKNFFFAR